jgi:hypothetical protein
VRTGGARHKQTKSRRNGKANGFCEDYAEQDGITVIRDGEYERFHPADY